MSKSLIILTMLIILVIILITAIVIVRKNKLKRIKDALNKLEVQKNRIDSSPIIPELAKVEAFLNNEKLEAMYNNWKKKLDNIKNVEVPRINDMILDAEYSLEQHDYKQTIYKKLQ